MMCIAIMQLAHIRSLDLNLLVALDALLAERHVTRAARRVGLTQSAMSHALGRLRAHLGDELFVRSPRGVLPTPRALALEAPLRAALVEMDRALAPEGAIDFAALDRTFVLGAADYAAVMLVPALLARVAAEAPRVNLRVRSAPQDTEGELERGAIDVSLALPIGLGPRLVSRHLFDDEFVCVVREGHPKVKSRLTLERFVELEHVQINVRGTPGGPVDSALAERGLSRRIACYVPHFLAAPLIVAESDLVLTMAARLAHKIAPRSGLRVLPTPLPVPGFAMHAIWHERVAKDPVHAWFRGLVADTARTVAASDRAKKARAPSETRRPARDTG